MTLHLDETRPLQGPVMAEVEGEADPGSAPPVPDADEPGRAMVALQGLAGRPLSGLMRLTLGVFGSLFALVLSVWTWNFVTGLLAANLWLGRLALGLTVAALVLAAFWVLRELWALARMGRIDRLRMQAAEAEAAGDLAGARRVVDAVAALYRGRADMGWALARLQDRRGEVLDADALLRLAEGELMAPLDAEARMAVEAASRQVAAVTAFVPLALADVVTALVANLRMIRRLAEIYGGRTGSFGAWSLLRRVFVNLAAAGALALTDDLIGSVAGGGLLSRLSRRFGEGVVNGALTARLGLAAMELCRPLPFMALDRPSTSATVTRALGGVFGSGGQGN